MLPCVRKAIHSRAKRICKHCLSKISKTAWTTSLSQSVLLLAVQLAGVALFTAEQSRWQCSGHLRQTEHHQVQVYIGQKLVQCSACFMHSFQGLHDSQRILCLRQSWASKFTSCNVCVFACSDSQASLALRQGHCCSGVWPYRGRAIWDFAAVKNQTCSLQSTQHSAVSMVCLADVRCLCNSEFQTIAAHAS